MEKRSARVWEVLSGKRNRSLQLTSLVIKTGAKWHPTKTIQNETGVDYRGRCTRRSILRESSDGANHRTDQPGSLDYLQGLIQAQATCSPCFLEVGEDEAGATKARFASATAPMERPGRRTAR